MSEEFFDPSQRHNKDDYMYNTTNSLHEAFACAPLPSDQYAEKEPNDTGETPLPNHVGNVRDAARNGSHLKL